MTFGEAVRSVLSQYATFAGRASRAEFWRWVVVFVLLTLITRMIDGALFASSIHESFYGDDARRPLTSIIILALLLPNIALAVRRLHDIGRSGWWLLLMVIPVHRAARPALLVCPAERGRTQSIWLSNHRSKFGKRPRSPSRIR
jgi:uncharacterized membrane protein YhaH (DUF805 family)